RSTTQRPRQEPSTRPTEKALTTTPARPKDCPPTARRVPSTVVSRPFATSTSAVPISRDRTERTAPMVPPSTGHATDIRATFVEARASIGAPSWTRSLHPAPLRELAGRVHGRGLLTDRCVRHASRRDEGRRLHRTR